MTKRNTEYCSVRYDALLCHHFSWLNMVEIEIGVMNQMCLDRRIPDVSTLKKELAVWETERNKTQASIKWLFDIDRARAELNRAYQGLNQSKPL